ncbi:MAG: DEAD/DEAH box helicase, partial [Halioglobus sp.]
MLTEEISQLPITEVLLPLKMELGAGDEVVLQAPPGAGKTTVVPLALLDQEWLGQKTILVLEPRRMAARSAAARMAQLLGEPIGQTVGYRIRLESCVSDKTRIEVITEGILTRRLQSDPGLEGVGLVIFDEFHERNLDSDLCLALALQGRELFREGPPLKLLVMSATLDGEA